MERAVQAERPLELRADPNAIAPERALVFEVVGSLPEFYAHAAAIGLEYLADDEEAIEPSNDFYDRDHPEKPIAGRMYLAMPSAEALSQLLRLWKTYLRGGQIAGGMWTQLFHRLRDVRVWGPQDRLPLETRDYLQLSVEADGPVRVEAELWYREDLQIRSASEAALIARVAEAGGQVLARSTIPEIRYHAVLVSLPAVAVRALLADPSISIAAVDEVMLIRPQTAVEVSEQVENVADHVRDLEPQSARGAAPILALLDGLPVENHIHLTNRLAVDDPDDLASSYTVGARRHGTSMASLIVRGDLNKNEAPLNRPIYIRPVLVPLPETEIEESPRNQLIVDLIHRAVRRIKVGEAGRPPVAPEVFLINLSLGDINRPFTGTMSPWARLLDYLAYTYRVLFLVSAGNLPESIRLGFGTWGEFESADENERERQVLLAIDASKATRTLLSPAEGLNGITVGAAHNDSVVHRHQPAMALDPFTSSHLPNVSSALGLGHRRVIKPDILLDGGREYLRFVASGGFLEVAPVRTPGRSFGVLAAFPNATGPNQDRVALTSGTSAATALASRGAHQIFDALMDVDGGSNHSDVPQQYWALVVKALLIHSASWGDRAALLESIFGPHGVGAHFERRDNISRLLGYGYARVDRVVDCAAERATLLGYGEVVLGQAALHRIPLPPTLEGSVDFRALTITVAWFSPINPRHQGYRAAVLDVGPGGDGAYSLAVARDADQPHDKAVRRGTVVQDRRSGRRAAVYVDQGDLVIRISARAGTGEIVEPVPYAIAVTLEVGAASGIDVYEEIRTAIEVRTQAQAQV